VTPRSSQKPTLTVKAYSGRGTGRSSSRAQRPSTCEVGAGMIENYVVKSGNSESRVAWSGRHTAALYYSNSYHRPMSTANIIRLVQTVLGASVAAFSSNFAATSTHIVLSSEAIAHLSGDFLRVHICACSWLRNRGRVGTFPEDHPRRGAISPRDTARVCGITGRSSQNSALVGHRARWGL